MIEKLKTLEDDEIDMSVGAVNTRFADTELVRKINELIGAVNKLETMAKNTNTVLESLVQENNIHEKQIDELQMKVEPAKNTTMAKNANVAENSQSAKIAQGFKNLQDPYAEQRKWIGKLCRFWDVATDKGTYGVLTDIKDDRYVCPNGMFVCNRIRYQHCEPVKPDDDIIYKGGENDRKF